MSKIEDYARQSARAAADIATWPAWMQRNLTPPTVHVPERIQRKRTRGWRMPEGAVYVGRPTEWGNPYAVGDDWGNPGEGRMSREDVVLCFDTYAAGKMGIDPSWLAPLRGRDLVCWCAPDQPCHADILLARANQPRTAGSYCARYALSDETLCSTHNGRFASRSENRCDRAPIRAAV